MTLGEANKILGTEFGKKYSVEDIQKVSVVVYNKYHYINLF